MEVLSVGVTLVQADARGEADWEAMEREGVKVALGDRELGAVPLRVPKPEALLLGVPVRPPLLLLAREAEGAVEADAERAGVAEALGDMEGAAEAEGAERVELKEAEARGVALAHAVAEARPVVVFDARREPVNAAEGLLVVEALALVALLNGVAQPDAEGDCERAGVAERGADEVALGVGRGVKERRAEAVALAEGDIVRAGEGDTLWEGRALAERASEVVRVGVAPPEALPLTETVEEGERAPEAVMEAVPLQPAAVSAICPQKAGPLDDMHRAAVPAGQ